jgi:hypothetical protein
MRVTTVIIFCLRNVHTLQCGRCGSVAFVGVCYGEDPRKVRAGAVKRAGAGSIQRVRVHRTHVQTVCTSVQPAALQSCYSIISHEPCHIHRSISEKIISMSQDSAVGTATGYRLDGRGVGVRVLARTGELPLLHVVQTGSRAHPAFYRMVTGGSFPGGKSAGA